MTVRTILERISRRWVIRRRMPKRFGSTRTYVTPDASLRYWLPRLEQAQPGLFRWVDELVEPGFTVWDVGANLGLFALAAAVRSGPEGRVVAVEPDDRLTGLIRRSASQLPRDSAPLDVITAAVSDEVTIARLAIARRGRAGNHLATLSGSTQTGGVRSVQPIVALSLDWLAERMPPPDLIKIDVEGAEAACLKGATRLLAEARPIILCEVTSRNTEMVGEFLERNCYHLFDAELPSSVRRPLRRPTWNTLAIPPSSLDQ